jgi:hypothetical protein
MWTQSTKSVRFDGADRDTATGTEMKSARMASRKKQASQRAVVDLPVSGQA